MKLRQLIYTALLALMTAQLGNAQELDAAIDDSQLINGLHQRSWVSLGDQGTVRGRVLVVEPNSSVVGRIDNKVVLARDGFIIHEAKTDNEGVFEFSGVKPGTYALQASGDYTFAAFALHVMSADANHLPKSLDVFATTVVGKLNEFVASSLVPADDQFGQDLYYRSHRHDPIATERLFNRDHQVMLQGGSLNGRVSRPGWTFVEQDLSGSVAHILKSGEIVDRVAVDRDGHYRFENVEPGIYDMVISGSDGFAAFRFQAVTEDGMIDAVATSISKDSSQLVAAKLVRAAVQDSLNSELIHQSDVFTSTMAMDMPVGDIAMFDDCGIGMAPCCGGGFAGGGGFGGGGFGGGGFGGGGGLGMGGLLGIGGLTAGIIALATDSGATTPSVPTPIAP